ncbi:MAG: 50S ribosomal protein L6 [bacterium]
MGPRPIDVPDEVDIDISNGTINASGPQGDKSLDLTEGITAEVSDGELVLSRRDDSKEQKSQHGLMRSLAVNLVKGVGEGFTKTLEINGLGYRVNKQGSTLTLELGYSNPIQVEIPDNLDVEVPNNTTIEVNGIDKEDVGQFASRLRHLREPDPYNQKGIKYEDETIRQKVGKAVGGGEGPEGAEGAEGAGGAPGA